MGKEDIYVNSSEVSEIIPYDDAIQFIQLFKNFYSVSSSPLLLRGAHYYSEALV